MQFNIFKYQDVYRRSTIGWEFEFYSNHSLEKTAKLVENLLGKEVQIEDKAHSDFVPTKDVFKMEPDMSGGERLIELVTGPMDYNEARLICIKFLGWLKDNGSTNEKSAIHVNVGFDSSLGSFISKMDSLKFILDFNEDYVFSTWPNRRDSIYARSIKYVLPFEKFYVDEIKEPIDPKSYVVPSEKYYGINFSKIIKNYLEFRYLGGSGYENRVQDILDMTDYFILSIYSSVMNPRYTEKNKQELKKILNEHKYVVDSYKSYEDFKKSFPKIKLTVDLSSNEKILDSFYGRIRDKVFNLLSSSTLRECLINFDTTLSSIQIKDADFSCWYCEGFEFVDCKISNSLIHRCDFYNCELVSSEIHGSNLYLGCVASGDKLKDCYLNKTVQANNCYIFGKNGVFNGKMEGGIFREGKISQMARISKSTEVIEYEEIKPVYLKNKLG